MPCLSLNEGRLWGFWFNVSNCVAGVARNIFHRVPQLRGTTEVALICFRNHLNDTVIVRCPETVALGPHELGTNILGLLACRIKPDYFSSDPGHAHPDSIVGDRAKPIGHRGDPHWKGVG